MPRKGPKRGAPNAGRPRIKLTDDQWKRIEQLAIVPGRTLTEVAKAVGINHARPDITLKRLIKFKYGRDAEDWFHDQSLIGIGMVKDAMFRDSLDGKHPITQIFFAKNYLGMRDEKLMVTDNNESNNKTLQALHVMSEIIGKITNRTPNIQKLESKNQQLEDAQFTTVNTHIQHQSPQPTEIKHYE